MNPLMLLDEIDKLGSDYKGDPSSALLEVLGLEQNLRSATIIWKSRWDLSNVLFLCNGKRPVGHSGAFVRPYGNYRAFPAIPARKNSRLPNAIWLLLGQNAIGSAAETAGFMTTPFYSIIDHYVREAGVRNLERESPPSFSQEAKMMWQAKRRAAAISEKMLETLLGPQNIRTTTWKKKKSGRCGQRIGVDLGRRERFCGGSRWWEGTGKLELTGSLGDVMKESARAAITCVRGLCDRYGIDKNFYKEKDIHIHFPEGAVPKDGPSAGVTITTALVSALSGMPVRHDVAMTGEITLRGRVLPIGGLKEKTMAAYRNGMKTVIIPQANEPDLYEVDPVVKENVKFVTAREIGTVLDTALLPLPLCPSQEQQEAPECLDVAEKVVHKHSRKSPQMNA